MNTVIESAITKVPDELCLSVLHVLRLQDLRDRCLKGNHKKLAEQAIKRLNQIRLDQERGYEVFQFAEKCRKDAPKAKWNLILLPEFKSMFTW